MKIAYAVWQGKSYLLENVVQMDLVQDDRVDSFSIIADLLANMNLGRQAHDRAADLVLLAFFYGHENIARVTSGQASHYEHDLSARVAPDMPDGRKKWPFERIFKGGHSCPSQTGSLLEDAHWELERVLNGRFAHTDLLLERMQGFDELLGIANQVADLLGRLAFGQDEAKLADGVLVEIAVDELLQQLEQQRTGL